MRITATWLLPTAIVVGAVIPLGTTDLLGYTAIVLAVIAALAIHDVMQGVSDRQP